MANLKNEGYELAESCTYSNGGRSEYYVKEVQPLSLTMIYAE